MDFKIRSCPRSKKSASISYIYGYPLDLRRLHLQNIFLGEYFHYGRLAYPTNYISKKEQSDQNRILYKILQKANLNSYTITKILRYYLRDKYSILYYHLRDVESEDYEEIFSIYPDSNYFIIKLLDYVREENPEFKSIELFTISRYKSPSNVIGINLLNDIETTRIRFVENTTIMFDDSTFDEKKRIVLDLRKYFPNLPQPKIFIKYSSE